MLNAYRLGIGMMLLNKKGKVFTGKRIGFPSTWEMPKGGIDKGELPKEALYREAVEEISTTNFKIIAESNNWLKCNFPIEFCKKFWNGKYIGQKQKWFLLVFLGQDSEINICTKEAEFKSWRWSDINDLTKTVVEFKRPLYKSVIKEFKPLILNYFNAAI